MSALKQESLLVLSFFLIVAFRFGPVAGPIYLIAEYRSTAAVYLPLYVALESTALASEPAALRLGGPG